MEDKQDTRIQEKNRRHLMIFFAVSLIQYIAANFAHPITPTLIHNLALRDYMFGAAFAAMALTNFLFSPFWGKMRDFFSLRRLIAVGCVGYGIGQYLFSISETESSILLARCIAGFFVGAIAVGSLIYITEISGRDQSGKNLARFVIIQALGAAGGYLLGGIIGFYSIRTTFLVQSLTLIACGGLYYLSMTEIHPQAESKKKIDRRSFFREINPLKTFLDCRSFLNPSLLIILGAVIFSGIGTNAFDQSFNYYLKAEFNMTPIYNGVMKAFTGIITLVFVSTVSMKLMKKAELHRPTARILFACAASIAALLFVTDTAVFLTVSLVFFSFNAIYTPLLQEAIARHAESGNRNMLMSLYNATRSLGMICGALIAGFLYNFGALIPFVFAAICFALAGIGMFKGYASNITP